MFKRILVAIDESDTSKLALKGAIKLAQKHNSTLCILHVIDHAAYSAGLYFLESKKLVETLRSIGHALLNKAKVMAEKNKIKSEVKLAEFRNYDLHVGNKIIEQADAYRADLIVMGSHGTRGFTHVLLGSVAEYALRSSTTPILIFKTRLKKN